MIFTFQNIGATELIIIGIIIMVLFGAKKLPEFARGLGSASSEFKKGLKGEDETDKKST